MSYDSEVGSESLEAELQHYQMTQAERTEERRSDSEGRVDERRAGRAGVSDKWKNNRCLKSLVVLRPRITA